MSIRAIFLISPTEPSGTRAIVYARRFSTVETRARRILGSKYVPIPYDDDIATSILIQVGLDAKKDSFEETRDSCIITNQMPVLAIPLKQHAKPLWPVVVMDHLGHLVCCVGFAHELDIEKDDKIKPSLVNLPSVSICFSVAAVIFNFLGMIPQFLHKDHQKLQELDSYVTVALPFGRPSELESSVLKTILLNQPVLTSNRKQPVQIPIPNKGRHNLSISISESVRAAQYEKMDIKDTVEVYGVITCKAEVETPMEISLSLSHVDLKKALPFGIVTVHPYVQEIDLNVHQSLPSGKKFRFSSHLDTMPICYYTIEMDNACPMRGTYKMRGGETNADIQVHLKLSEGVRNYFEICEVQIPFFHHCRISSADLKPSWGAVKLSSDRRRIVWTIGQKFPTKSMEVLLTGNICFKKGQDGKLTGMDNTFCELMNSYAEVYFKIPDYTMSGCFVDVKSIQLSPSAKIKMTTERVFTTTDYKLWNVFGDAPYSYCQKND